PELTRVVEHWELVLESITGGGVTLPLGELLSSRPDHGSSRPLRRLYIVGAPLDVQVTLPPRAALGALSPIAVAGSTHAALALSVTRDAEGLLRLAFMSPPAQTAGTLVCLIPFMGPLPPSREVAFWVIERIGARPCADGDDR